MNKPHPTSSGVVIVTGGSRGIGAATVRLAAERGYAVCVNYRERADAADDVVATIERAGGRAVAVRADVSVEADVMRMFEACDTRLGTLTALVNNAGIVAAQSKLESIDGARMQRMMGINVIGSLLCAREAVKRMSTAHGGHGGAIVNLSSIAARLGSPNEYVDYAASKGAIESFTVGLAREVAGEGIRVNAVRAGLTYTDIHASSGEPGRVDRLKSAVPMQRGGQPEEVARAILWLLSDDSSYSTGAIVDVSGGR
jgi:NAD(P)-dependent dehydrogenase (short-subunit alcohol dehydrogenase family)